MPKACPELVAGKCCHPKSQSVQCVMVDPRAKDCKLRQALERVETLVRVAWAPKPHSVPPLKGRPGFVGPPKPKEVCNAQRNVRRRAAAAKKRQQKEEAKASPFDALFKGN